MRTRNKKGIKKVKSETRKFKKMLASTVALVAVISLVAAACSHSDDDASPTTAPPRTAATQTTSSDPANAPGFDGTTIKIGFLTDLTGPLVVIGGPIRDGSQIYWDYVNEELGGIAGKYKVELVVEDTNDKAATAVQAYQKIKDDVVMFGEILSTHTSAAISPFLIEDEIVAIPGSLSARWVREPNFLPQAAPYEYEMINIIDWWHNTQSDGNDVYCSVYVDDAYGTTTLTAVTYIAEQLGIEIAEEVSIDRGDTDFTTQLTRLEEANCTVVAAITVPTEQNILLAAAATADYKPVWLGALPSYLSLFGAVPTFAPNYENFYYAQDAPGLTDTSVEGIVNFKVRFEKYKSTAFSTFNLAGYFLSFGAHALLERAAELGDFSRAGILRASEELGEVDVEGLAAQNYVYGPASERVPPKGSRIFEHEPDNGPDDFINEVANYTSIHIDGFPLPTP